MIGAVALAALLSSCAPKIAPDTMSAIIEVESGNNELSLHDNTTRKSYEPRDYRRALAIAQGLIARGDSVDVGLAQINSGNFAGYRTNAAQMLFACQNLIVAAQILSGAYTTAQAAYPEPSVALYRALGAYNTGSIHAGDAYAAKVVAAASVPSISIIAGPLATQSAKTAVPRRSPSPQPSPTPTPVPPSWHGNWGPP